jgi:hypothetical protein
VRRTRGSLLPTCWLERPHDGRNGGSIGFLIDYDFQGYPYFLCLMVKCLARAGSSAISMSAVLVSKDLYHIMEGILETWKALCLEVQIFARTERRLLSALRLWIPLPVLRALSCETGLWRP